MHLNSDDCIAAVINDNKVIFSIIEKIKKSNNIIVLGHVEPDGDCIGAQLALTTALKEIGKNAYAINSGPFEQSYPKRYEKHFHKEQVKSYDLAFVVDTSNKERIALGELDLDPDKTIIIDHHATCEQFGALNWVDPEYVSSSEMVFLLIYSLQRDLITGHIAQYLINGILSDNGYFQHIRKNKHFSLLASYYLVNCGADPKRSYDEMFVNSSVNIEKLTALVLGRIEEEYNGRLLWTYITEDDKMAYNTDIASLKVFKVMMNIRNSSVYILFKVNEKSNKVVVSFRSIDRLNVSKVAAKFGGGGHRVAAGVTMDGTFSEVKERVIREVETLLEEEKA